MMSIMQPINAQAQHEKMPTILGGGVADKSRPEALAGLGLHEVLYLADQTYAPIGNETNRWIGTGEFQSIVEKIGRTELSQGNADNDGLTIETSFGKGTALTRLQTQETHPTLGTGLLATLQIPVYGTPKEIADECAGMNLVESSWAGDFPQLGCWCPYPSRTGGESPTFGTFVPNALHRPGIAHFVATWMLRRARWVREQHYPSITDEPIEAIMRNRFSPD